MRKSLFALPFLLIFMACSTLNEQKEASSSENQIVAKIESAHQMKAWTENDIVSFDLAYYKSGKVKFMGKISMSPDGGKVKIEDSSKVLIWDGQKAWSSDEDDDISKIRFRLLTWSYFFAAPYKLSDPGTIISEKKERPLGEATFPSFKLEFEDGVGDSPEDWYIVYKTREDDLLAAMAYIVTYKRDKSEAEEDPHLISYEAYEVVNGIPVATQWNFWSWNEKGEMNKLLGSATISNVRFIKKADDFFQAPA